MYADLEWREHVRRYLIPRSLEALAEMFGVTPQTIHNAEKRQPRTMDAEVYREIIRIRSEYWLGRQEMKSFELAVIGKRYGLTKKTVCKHQAIYYERKFHRS